MTPCVDLMEGTTREGPPVLWLLTLFNHVCEQVCVCVRYSSRSKDECF